MTCRARAVKSSYEEPRLGALIMPVIRDNFQLSILLLYKLEQSERLNVLLLPILYWSTNDLIRLRVSDALWSIGISKCSWNPLKIDMESLKILKYLKSWVERNRVVQKLSLTLHLILNYGKRFKGLIGTSF